MKMSASQGTISFPGPNSSTYRVSHYWRLRIPPLLLPAQTLEDLKMKAWKATILFFGARTQSLVFGVGF